MRILYATAFFPFPPNSGGRLRVKNMLDGLAKEHQLHLLSIGFEPQDRTQQRQQPAFDVCQTVTVVPHVTHRPLAALKTLLTGRPYELNLLWNAAFARKFQELAEQLQPDVVWCSRITTAQYWDHLPAAHHPRPLVVLDQHDLASYLWRLIREKSQKPWERTFAQLNQAAVRRFEDRIYRQLDVAISVSEHEREMTAEIAPAEVKLLVAPNGVDTDFFRPQAEIPEDPLVVSMVGQMNGIRNIDAALFFADEILPLLRQEYPRLEFVIVGANPDSKIRRLGERPGITVTGYVEDVRPYLHRSAVIVLPHRMGSGVKHKLPIAMAAAKPVVTTSNGCQGIAVRDRQHAMIRDDASGFAAAVSELLADRALRQQIGEAARRLVVEAYDWQAITARISKEITSIHEQRTGT